MSNDRGDPEERRGKLARDRRPVRPTKLAHVVRRTSRFEELVAWYQTVFEARIVHSNGMLAFLTYDDEHHRFAIVGIPGPEAQPPRAAGTDHVAFSYADLGDLLHTYERLRQAGIEPYWCINHGPTTSLYYRDPDGSQVELQVDNFASIEDADRWMRTEEFAANPIGVIFEPADLLARYRAGEPLESLVRRPPLPEGVSPFEMLRF